MEGRKGFEAPQNEPHVDEDIFDSEMDEKIDQLDDEIREEGFDQKSREICERILQQQRLTDVVAIFNVSTKRAYYVEFAEEALSHVEELITKEIVVDSSTESQFVLMCCETFERYGFPQENIARAIVKGLIQEGTTETGEQVFDFTLSTIDTLNFIRALQSRYYGFSTKLLVTPQTQAAALLRMHAHRSKSDTQTTNLKTPKELIQAFHLEGPDVTEVILEIVEDTMRRGVFNQKKVELLYSDRFDEEYEEGVTEATLDEAWKKLQDRYQITEGYQEIRRKVFAGALGEKNSAKIKKICNTESEVLRELVTEETLPRLLKLAEDTIVIVSGIGRGLEDPSYRDKGWIVGATLEQLEIPLSTVKGWFNEASLDNKLYLQRFAKTVLDADAVLTLDILGGAATGASYKLIRAIKSGGYTELENTGITQVGESGILQLRDMLSRLKRDVLQEKLDIREIENNSVLYAFLKKYLRIDEREFGTKSLMDSLEFYRHRGGLTKPLDGGVYQRSEALAVRTRGENKDFKYSEQFLSAYKTLIDDICKAQQMSLVVAYGERKKPLTRLIGMLEDQLAKTLEVLQKTLIGAPQEKQSFIQERITLLESINFRDLTQLDRNLQVITRIPEAHSIARQLIFTFVFAKSDAENPYFPPEERKKIELDDITGVINFVDHIGYQETWAKYFNDKRSRNAFRQIASTKALEEELERMQKSASGERGTTVMQFVPTRGFLMEVSGSLADACWQDTNDDLIAIEHPNFTSVTFVQNPETKDERIAGACMLIETESRDGEPLLVIRGLNPLENVINRLSVGDFYKTFTKYCKGVAERGGRKLAIVIDDHSGGSSTNRPALFQFLRSLQLRKVVLASDEDTNFNGYSVVNDTFLVE